MARYDYTPMYKKLYLENEGRVTYPLEGSDWVISDFFDGEIDRVADLLIFSVTEEGVNYWFDLIKKGKWEEANHTLGKYIYFIPEEWR